MNKRTFLSILLLAIFFTSCQFSENIYLNEDGSASSLDKAGLLKELQESPMFKPLTSYTPPSQGGGNMNGTNGGSAPTGTPKTLEECKGDRKLEALYFNSQLQG